MSDYDIVAELRRWGSFKVGDPPPAPDNAWGPPLTKLLNQAADEIERLRLSLECAELWSEPQ